MSTVARLGVPYEYIVRVKEVNHSWVREALYLYDLKNIHINDILAEYLDCNEVEHQKPYKTIAIRIDKDYMDELREFADKTGLTIKFITHMILTIVFNNIGDDLDE